jgi:hypothetical protein
MEEKRIACGILIGKPGGKSPVESPVRRWEYNIKINWIGLMWLRRRISGRLL